MKDNFFFVLILVLLLLIIMLIEQYNYNAQYELRDVYIKQQKDYMMDMIANLMKNAQ